MLRDTIKRAGGPTYVANLLGLTRGAIHYFISRGKVPAEHCPIIEKDSGGAVRCEELNPDVDWSYLRTPSSQETKAAS
ncbi:helix-turn-helix domain-containing protein [Gilvimarinus sp. 1_MG-2023]|uniref:helix-turn-helix domain-containing protein n=1 Tax=Gilvimarinus sp. 1_MG-2023 TaxID=3062638 RepID=UPI0026E3F9AB|nr:helix-turn-helix domain-containing protein [Gilvimarinus sp. 1_MG-2023]MDO6747179.1 helix-turn-helix domain-containing protein [Gilvimarinus sp. 1_MG-2023]